MVDIETSSFSGSFNQLDITKGIKSFIPIIIDTYPNTLPQGEEEQRGICVGAFSICKTGKRKGVITVNGMKTLGTVCLSQQPEGISFQSRRINKQDEKVKNETLDASLSTLATERSTNFCQNNPKSQEYKIQS